MTPTSADDGLDAWLQLQGSTGTLLADRDVGYDDAPETLTFSQATGSTTYYVVCRSADFVDAGSGDYTLQVSLLLPRPDLTAYQPNGWSDKIVVTTATGTTTDSNTLTSTNTLFVDCAILNEGNSSAQSRFTVALFVDGVQQQSGFVDPPLESNFFVSIRDHVIGPLSIGTHTLRIVADSTSAIAENDEADNEYTKTITVVDDDPNDEISGAGTLGALNQTLTAPGVIDGPTDVDLFSFTVAAGQRISFDIDQNFGFDSHLRLFNASGIELVSNNNAAGPGETLGLFQTHNSLSRPCRGG